MTRAESPIEVLYRDAAMVAVAKPAGLLVHRTRASSDRHFLLQTLRDQLGSYLFPVHRIDRAASGIIVFAFSSEGARLLQMSICADSARKEYRVLVRGSTPERWESRRPLTGPSGEPQPAWSTFEKIAELSRSSLVRAWIHTGRRHQIRRHLAHQSHQVIGDTSYGKGKINRFLRERYGLPRLFLHARRLDISHPRSGEPLTIEAPLAEDLRCFLERLPDWNPALQAQL